MLRIIHVLYSKTFKNEGGESQTTTATATATANDFPFGTEKESLDNKELLQRIKALEEQNSALQSKVDSLAAKLDSLIQNLG